MFLLLRTGRSRAQKIDKMWWSQSPTLVDRLVPERQRTHFSRHRNIAKHVIL